MSEAHGDKSMRLWGIIPGKTSWGEFTGGISPTGSSWCLQIRFGGDAVTQTGAAAGAFLQLLNAAESNEPMIKLVVSASWSS